VKRTMFAPLLFLFLFGALVPASRADAAVTVITTTEDLAALTREIGGDKVKVESLARGYQDPHFVEPKPSFILKLHSADLLIAVGRELEIGWLPPLIQQSRNPKIQPGSDGYLDASLNVKILELPTGAITRAMGDVHPLGNPHYWLDPGNGRKIAQTIQQKLTSMSGGDAAYFAQRYADFDKRLTEAEKRWDAEMAPYKALKIVTYHNSWPNFASRFQLNVVGYVEPRPGIPPSPSHTLELMQAMKKDNVKIILVEPYFDLKTPNAIARETGARVLVMAPSVGGVDKIASYIDLFDYDIKTLVSAIKETVGTGAGASH
jgi:zinc/manganese transport system substrate-binding protein